MLSADIRHLSWPLNFLWGHCSVAWFCDGISQSHNTSCGMSSAGIILSANIYVVASTLRELVQVGLVEVRISFRACVSMVTMRNGNWMTKLQLPLITSVCNILHIYPAKSITSRSARSPLFFSIASQFARSTHGFVDLLIPSPPGSRPRSRD